MSTASPIVERVKKLLALAQSENQHERDQALARANALIAEHNIDMVLVESSETSKPEEFAEEELVFNARLPVELKYIGWLLHNHFRCEIVYSGRTLEGHYGRAFRILGRRSDAEFGRWLAAYLMEEFRRRWVTYKRANGAALGERGTFMYGMYKGLDQRLAEEAKAVESRRISEIAQAAMPAVDGIARQVEQLQAVGALQEKYTLAVQGESEKRGSELARRYPRLRNSTTRLRLRDGSALRDGMAHGRTISTARPLAA